MTTTVFHNCTVITCADEPTVLTDAVFEVDDGVLTRVRSGPLGDGTADEVIDLAGAYVMPGLWDAHIHLGSLVPPHENGLIQQDPRHHMARCIARAQDNLRRGITSVRSLGERDGADLMVRDLVEDGVLTGPRVLASGDVHWSLSECGVDNFRRRVRDLILSGVDQIKLLVTGGIPFRGSVTSPTANRAEVEAAITEAHAWGKPVAVHAMGDTAVTMAAEAGADTIEHAFACTPAAAKAMASAGTIYCANLAVTECWTRESVRSQGLPDWLGDNAAQARSGHHETFAAAVELGVTVCAGVDNLPRRAGDYGIERVGDVPGLVVELELMHRNGLGILETLRAGTLNSAVAAGRGDELGSLEPGKVADFVVLADNPVDDLRNLTQVREVWQGGTLVHRA